VIFNMKNINYNEINDFAVMFDSFTKIKPWSKLPIEISKEIFKNSNRDLEQIKRFIIISDMYKCLDRNYLPIIKTESDQNMVLGLFSLTLERIASQAIQNISNYDAGSHEQKIALVTAGMAFDSALLCNPNLLTAYYGKIYLCIIQNDITDAMSILSKYYKAKETLVNCKELGNYDLSILNKVNEIQNNIDVLEIEIRKNNC